MRDEAELSVLRRKAGAGRAETALAAMTPLKALRLALARVADEALGVPVSVRDCAEEEMLPEALAAALPDPALVVQIDGPDRARGLAVLCPQAVAAIVEAQTMGRVLASAAPERRLTRTDAMLVAEFLDLALVGFAALAAECADAALVCGFSFGVPLADARAGEMVLDEVRHTRFRMVLDFGGGAKTGALQLVFPAERKGAAAAGPADAAWRATLRQSVLGTSGRIEAVLCRLRLPLAEIGGFAVGDMLRLGQASLDGVALTGPDGAKVAQARLGRAGAMRAVRLRFRDAKPPPALYAPALPGRAEEEQAGAATAPDAVQPAAAAVSDD